MMWDIDQMKPLSATVVLSFFTPYQEPQKHLKASFDQYPTKLNEL